MNKDGYDLFDLNDIPMPDDEQSPLAKALTFESSDPFAPPPDTTSEFHRLHTAEAADRLHKLFMLHGVEESAAAVTGDAAYLRMDAGFRKLLEKCGYGRERLRAVAREAIREEGL
jgi:hypothetical protein